MQCYDPHCIHPSIHSNTKYNVEYINVMCIPSMLIDVRRSILWSLIFPQHIDIVIKVIINKLWLNGSYVTLLRQPDNYRHFYLLLNIQIAIFPLYAFCFVFILQFLQNIFLEYRRDFLFLITAYWPNMVMLFFSYWCLADDW